MKTTGRYTCASSLLPDAYVGIVDVVALDTRCTQTVYQPALKRTLQRSYNGSAWGSWGRVDGYGCSSLEALADAVGSPVFGERKGSTYDANTPLAYRNKLIIDSTNGQSNRPQNVPTNIDWGNLISFCPNDTQTSQLVIDPQNIYVRFRDGSNFGGWREIATDIPDFYKSYNSLDALQTGLGTIKLSVADSKIVMLQFNDQYSAVISARGNTGSGYAYAFISGYGKDIIRNNVTRIANGFGLSYYASNTYGNTLYISGINTLGQLFITMLSKGVTCTTTILDSLPSDAVIFS